MMRWPLRITRCYPLQLDCSLSSSSAGISHLLAQVFILTPHFSGCAYEIPAYICVAGAGVTICLRSEGRFDFA